MTGKSEQNPLVSDYLDMLEPVFDRGDANAFEYVCALLRVGGDRSTGWDPFQEARELVADLGILARLDLPKVPLADADKTRVRLGLIAWNQLATMAAPYQVIANLLRVKAGMPYADDPFFHLRSGAIQKAGKRKPLARDVALSPKRKIDEIKRLAELVENPRIGEAFDGFYHADLHHAISLSDYVLEGGELRMLRRPAPPRKTPVDTSVASYALLQEMTARAQAYFTAFIQLEAKAQKQFANLRGKCVPYDPGLKGLLELLIDDDGGLCGIKVHWPNKTESIFRRRGVECDSKNVTFDSDGSVNFFVGEYFDDHNPLSPLVPEGRDLEYTPAEGSTEPPKWPEGLEAPSPR